MAELGLLGGLGLLIWLALRGVNVIFASLLCSLVVILTNSLPITQSLTNGYTFGPLGAFSFAGKFFILFVCGSIFGRVMSQSQAASSLALKMTDRLGSHRALWIITLVCALLTYGGVLIFIVIFTLYPLSIRLLEEANIPKRLFAGALALGGGTFTLTALPGTPSLQNVMAASKLGTDLFAGATLGIAASIMMFALGMWYLESQRRKAKALGEGYETSSNQPPSQKANATAPTHCDNDRSELPHWLLSIVPIIVVLATIMLPRLFLMISGATVEQSHPLIQFALSQPIMWPSFALLLGCVISIVLFPSLRTQLSQAFGQGTNDAIMPLMSTAAVIGFGGVVVQTQGFAYFTQMLLETDLPPYLSLYISASLTSGLVGSASGGMQIFLETMSSSYLAMGIPQDTLHRMASIISGGLDSLPHCGAVIALLAITGLTHKQAYKDIAIITVVIPMFVAAILSLFLSFA